MANSQAARKPDQANVQQARNFLEKRLAGHFAANPTKLNDPGFILDCAISYVADADKHLERQRQEIVRLISNAQIDDLTQILNEAGFDRALKQALARAERHQEKGVLVLFDIAQFRQINDVHSRSTGDAVLSLVAELLRRNVRTADAVARLSADMFAALLINTSSEDGTNHAKRLQGLMNSQIQIPGDHYLSITAHLGTVDYGAGCNSEELMAMARQALFRSKIARTSI